MATAELATRPGVTAQYVMAILRTLVVEADADTPRPAVPLTAMEITTVADDFVVAHDGYTVTRLDNLLPDHEYEVRGRRVRTLARPGGELLCRFATVNDVHFGEVECGRVDDHHSGPIVTVAPGEPPYPETMNRGAIDAMLDSGIDTVIVKGDLTSEGTPEQFADFERYYRSAFGERLYVVRGNHDAFDGQQDYSGDQWIELPGLNIALVDTSLAHHANGRIRAEQLEWLDDITASSDGPVIVMGHHQQWIEGERDPDYFGIEPDSSDGLSEVVARRRAILAYTAGHTHRHRVRPMPGSGVPSIEVGCVKDFPGVWAEYRVYEGGVAQIAQRVSTPEALSWSERCRHLYSDFGLNYEPYALGSLDERCFNILPR